MKAGKPSATVVGYVQLECPCPRRPFVIRDAETVEMRYILQCYRTSLDLGGMRYVCVVWYRM